MCGADIVDDITYKLLRFAYSWNIGILEHWNIGFWENGTLGNCKNPLDENKAEHRRFL